MSVSYVIRTKNSAKTLGFVLKSLLFSIDSSKIICVDSGSTDGTLGVIKSAGVRCLDYGPGLFNYSRALNMGFDLCDTRWAVALSSHCVPVLNTFGFDYERVLMGRMMPESVDLVAGAVLQSKSKFTISDDLLLSSSMVTSIYLNYYNGNPNCAYRVSEWRKRPFSEELVAAEDYAWLDGAILNARGVGFSFAVPVYYNHQMGLLAAFRKGRQVRLGYRTCMERSNMYSDYRFSVNRVLQRLAVEGGKCYGQIFD